MKKAYEMWKEGKASIYKAAKLCGIPQQTLRDRTTGMVDPTKFTSGRDCFLTSAEEDALVSYIKEVASCGFGFTRNGLAELTAETSFYMKRRDTNAPFSNKWVYRFLLRWPELKMTERQHFPIGRARFATRETVDNYYKELLLVLQKYKLLEKPHRIFNMVEINVSPEALPSKVLTPTGRRALSTVPKQKTSMTVISCINAAGEVLPPYLIFKGKRKSKDLLTGALLGTRSTVSESGCSDSQTLERYFTEHFLTSISGGQEERTLLLYDGHDTHVPVPLIDWAREHNIIMFLLPTHTSNVLQSTEADTIGPFEAAYQAECCKFLRQNPGKSMTRHDTCCFIANAYRSAMTPENIIAGFRRVGIFPFNATLVTDELAGNKVRRSNSDDDIPQEQQDTKDELQEDVKCLLYN